MTTDLRKWLAFGTGVGIEIRAKELDVTVARVRPGGVSVLGSASVTDYRDRPASEWGNDVTAFLRGIGAAHVAATVILPRHEVIVRVLPMPGVSDKDLESAIVFQLDGLHPYAEDEAMYTYARLGASSNILIGITRRDVVDTYSALFSEAGIKVATFTFSAAAIYAAMRVLDGDRTPRNTVAVHAAGDDSEIYGESDARPIFSANFDSMRDRAVALAIAELRLPPDATPVSVASLLPRPIVFPDNHNPESSEFESHALPYASAVAGAVPRLSLPLNLLPEDRRRFSSRARYAPTAILGALLLLVGGALLAESRWEDSRYLSVLQGEIKRFEPRARRASAIDTATAGVRARTQALDDFRKRTRQDLDVLGEITRLMPPPAYVTSFELTRSSANVAGETPAAADLLKTFDNSAYFKESEFTTGIIRTGTGEGFRIRMNRKFPSGPVTPAPPVSASKETPSPVSSFVAAPTQAPITAPNTAAPNPPATTAAAPAPVQIAPRAIAPKPARPNNSNVPPGFGGAR